jgi:hypothetical protein
MARKLYNICITKGSYKKDGEDKKIFLTVGSVLESDTGPFILLDPTINFAAFPRLEGRDMLMLSLYKPKKPNPKNSF